jgi:hypothetical protein
MGEPRMVTCDFCDGTGVTIEQRLSMELLADHSKALEFVREIASVKCVAECGTCIRCRASEWLHTEGKRCT